MPRDGKSDLAVLRMRINIRGLISQQRTKMARVRAFVLSTLVGAALSLGSVAQAGTIYDNLSAAASGSDFVATFGPLADSFSTTAATTLVDVKFLLSGDPTVQGTTSVFLLNDASTSPGSVIAQLGTISDSSLTTSLSVQDVSGFAPVALAAGTRFWIELSSSNTSAQWSFSSDTTGPGVAGEFFSNKSGVFSNSDDSPPYQMLVNTGLSVVPEPSTLTLGILGIGTLVALRRRLVR
jgi:hypothetical protein